ncbi:5'-adenylylsulfate reductase-like [Ancistrocladus abbreviatus]
MMFWVKSFGFVVLMVLGRLTLVEPAHLSAHGSCPIGSITDLILGFRDSVCDPHDGNESSDAVVVIEGGLLSLQKALQWVDSNRHGYAAVLFYASWCSFSRAFRPSFSVLASLYPSVPHFAIEESAIRPSILSKYGVHGFPTLFLINSTFWERYAGSRSFSSLTTFYGVVTGIKTDPLHQTSLNGIECPLDHDRNKNNEPENCPFSWARSPENLLQQETYLALATAFVLLRLLHSFFPYLLEFARFPWRGNMHIVRLGRLWEHPLAYINRATHLFNFLNYPCKRSNLQEGAVNARAWASKSLASAVAIGEASTNRGVTIGENH